MNNFYKQIWELECSKNILDRMNFLKRLNEIIEIKKEDIKYLDEDNLLLENEKKFLKAMQTKAESYDVYSQRTPYKCSGCRQYIEECLCKEMQGEDENKWIEGLDL